MAVAHPIVWPPSLSDIDTPHLLMRFGRALVVGALGGTAGTTLMSAAMLGARRAGFVGRLPPERITERIFFTDLGARN